MEKELRTLLNSTHHAYHFPYVIAQKKQPFNGWLNPLGILFMLPTLLAIIGLFITPIKLSPLDTIGILSLTLCFVPFSVFSFLSTTKGFIDRYEFYEKEVQIWRGENCEQIRFETVSQINIRQRSDLNANVQPDIELVMTPTSRLKIRFTSNKEDKLLVASALSKLYQDADFYFYEGLIPRRANKIKLN